MNPRPSFKYLVQQIYSTSGHGLSAPASLDTILEAEKEYPNATRDAVTLVSVAAKYLGTTGRSKRALDIGSGYGFFSKAAIEAGFDVVAVNPGRWENEIYRQLVRRDPIERPFEETEFDSKFDLIILSQVLEHILEPSLVLEKVARIMNERGVVAIAVPNFNWILVRLLRERENGLLWVPEHLNYFTEAGLSALLERTGFRTLETRHVARIPYYAVSERLHLYGTMRTVVNKMVQISQWVPMRVLEWLKSGITIQAWGTPRAGL